MSTLFIPFPNPVTIWESSLGDDHGAQGPVYGPNLVPHACLVGARGPGHRPNYQVAKEPKGQRNDPTGCLGLFQAGKPGLGQGAQGPAYGTNLVPTFGRRWPGGQAEKRSGPDSQTRALAQAARAVAWALGPGSKSLALGLGP